MNVLSLNFKRRTSKYIYIHYTLTIHIVKTIHYLHNTVIQQIVILNKNNWSAICGLWNTLLRRITSIMHIVRPLYCNLPTTKSILVYTYRHMFFSYINYFFYFLVVLHTYLLFLCLVYGLDMEYGYSNYNLLLLIYYDVITKCACAKTLNSAHRVNIYLYIILFKIHWHKYFFS